eukprot:COSAG02_NODE_61603_length_268_cov_0.609467_1_plen_55_part_01
MSVFGQVTDETQAKASGARDIRAAKAAGSIRMPHILQCVNVCTTHGVPHRLHGKS